MIVTVEQAALRLGTTEEKLLKKIDSFKVLAHALSDGKNIFYFWYENEIQRIEAGQKLEPAEMKRNWQRWTVLTLGDLIVRTSLPSDKIQLICEQCEFPSYKVGPLTVWLEKEINMKVFDAEVLGITPKVYGTSFKERVEDNHIEMRPGGGYLVYYKLKNGRRKTLKFPASIYKPENDSLYLAKARKAVRDKIGVGKPKFTPLKNKGGA